MRRNKFPRKDFAWTPDLAYAVGLLVTDGCLSSDGRHIILTSSDIEQLENFKKCLNLRAKIGSKRNLTGTCNYVGFSNVQLYDWLCKIGLSPRKSLTIGKIDIPDKFFRDFLRGDLDGDGTITSYTDHWNTIKNPKYIYKRIFLRFVSASKIHMEWLQKMCIKNLGVTGRLHTIISKRKGASNMYTLKFGKKESLKALSQIYYSDTIPFLKRKRDIYEQFVKNN